ncbi:MAG TPA: hypothetical protein PKC68_04620 [Alphaproteobacteria bacterium]|nr:hypothetical protein [Alphaproteobacteria bacterium]
MTATLSSLPNEAHIQKILLPYKIQPSKMKFLIGPFVAFLVSLGAVGGIGWLLGPSLWRDWQGGSDWLLDRYADVVDGECQSKSFLVACDAYLEASDGRRVYVAYFFLGSSSKNYAVDILQSAKNPDILTTDLGIDNFTNRLMVFLVLELGFFVIAIAMLRQFLRVLNVRRMQRYVHDSKPEVKLVHLSIPNHSKTRTNKKPVRINAKQNWLFTPIQSGSKSYNHQSVSTLFRPLLISSQPMVGVALISRDKRQAVLLDDRLESLNIFGKNRQAVLNSLKETAR